MDLLRERAVALVRESIRVMVEESLDPDGANLAEIETLARLAGAPSPQSLAVWIQAARARSGARAERARTRRLVDEARRERTRGRLRVIDGLPAKAVV